MTCHTIYVHNYHLDGYGHVNNARYLEFLEEARWHFFRQHDLRDEMRAAQMVVSHMDIAYRHAATRDQELTIVSEILQVQSRKLLMKQKIQLSGSNTVCVQATVTLMPTQNGKISRLPENLIQLLQLLIQL